MEESEIVVGAATDVGNARDRNQDLEFHGPVAPGATGGSEAYLLAVADGMGGHNRGDVASRLAIDTLVDHMQTIDEPDVSIVLRRAFRAANQDIYTQGVANGADQLMGTTMVAALIVDDELTIANVGDSRAYLLRAGALTQVTEDHSLVAEQVKMGVLSETEARTSGHKNIVTRALGQQDRVTIDIYELTLLPKDRLLLTSDGIHDYLDVDEMRQIISDTDPEDGARALISSALAQGSTDNLTALMLWMAPVSELYPAEEPVAAGRFDSILVPAIVVLGLIILIAAAVLIVAIG